MKISRYDGHVITDAFIAETKGMLRGAKADLFEVDDNTLVRFKNLKTRYWETRSSSSGKTIITANHLLL